jgi:hypothetical protein
MGNMALKFQSLVLGGSSVMFRRSLEVFCSSNSSHPHLRLTFLQVAGDGGMVDKAELQSQEEHLSAETSESSDRSHHSIPSLIEQGKEIVSPE